jgi:hypothetical protein
MRLAGEKLTPRQESALVALLDCGEVQAAALQARVAKGTLWRWLQLPEFQTRYRTMRRQLVENAIAQLQADCTIAARVLRAVAEDKEAPASARVAAARAILEQSVAAIQLTDLQAEVDEIKRLLAAREGATGATRARA